MSRNNKNATRMAQARTISAQRKAGNKGVSRTTPVHGKRYTYRNNPEILKRISEMVKLTAGPDEKTAAKRILKGAGKAAQPVA